MKKHLEIGSNYWHNYVYEESPKKIEEVITEESLLFNNLSLHLDIYKINPNEVCKGNVIFIHGTAVYSRFYAEFFFKLYQNGYNVIALDLPGHGLSGGTRGHFSMKKITDSIGYVVKYVRNNFSGKICLMGSSLGGISALYSALSNIPIDYIICHNAALFHEKAYKSIISVDKILVILMRMVPFFSKLFPRLRLSVFKYLPANKLVNSSKGHQIFAILQNDQLLAGKYTLLSLRNQMKEPPQKSINKLNVPTTFINGEQDKLFTLDFMQKLFNRLPVKEKNFIILRQTAHLIFQDNIPEVLNQILPHLEKKLM